MRKHISMLLIVITILGLSIGYSALNTDLSISGVATVKKQNFASYLITSLYEFDGKNNLYYFDGKGNYNNSDKEVIDKSYRFSGTNPNNYVCFGTDEEICPLDNLYRIIGIFSGKVKLIKADYSLISDIGVGNNTYLESGYNIEQYLGKQNLSLIGVYYWSNNKNIWNNSLLNTNNLNDVFVKTFDSRWQNMIDVSDWYINGYSTSSADSKTWYINEMSGISTKSKIGLMYVSDYGYSANPNYWNINVNSYSVTAYDNWLFLGLYEWTISPATTNEINAFRISNFGNVAGNNIEEGLAVRPCFYLKNDISYFNGTGTIEDPYRIG